MIISKFIYYIIFLVTSLLFTFKKSNAQKNEVALQYIFLGSESNKMNGFAFNYYYYLVNRPTVNIRAVGELNFNALYDEYFPNGFDTNEKELINYELNALSTILLVGLSPKVKIFEDDYIALYIFGNIAWAKQFTTAQLFEIKNTFVQAGNNQFTRSTETLKIHRSTESNTLKPIFEFGFSTAFEINLKSKIDVALTFSTLNSSSGFNEINFAGSSFNPTINLKSRQVKLGIGYVF